MSPLVQVLHQVFIGITTHFGRVTFPDRLRLLGKFSNNREAWRWVSNDTSKRQPTHWIIPMDLSQWKARNELNLAMGTRFGDVLCLCQRAQI
jgi:hypothetical protein